MRTCANSHPEPRPDICWLCYLYESNVEYRKAGGGDPKTARPDLPPPAAQKPPAAAPSCRHLGEPTGETRECESCNGRVRLKVMACAVYGICAVARQVDGLACCAGCPDRQPG